MANQSKKWKLTGIYLFIFNLILLVIFAGFVIENKVVDTNVNFLDKNIFDIRERDDILIGDKNANLTIVLYNDYDSPFCKKFDKKNYQKLEEEYIDTGKINIIVRNFMLGEVHKESLIKGQIVKCVREQNITSQIHEEIFQYKKLDDKDMQDISINSNIDYNLFTSCVKSENYFDDMLYNTKEAKELNITVVPTFFIQDKKIDGVQPYFVMKKILDKELKNLS